MSSYLIKPNLIMKFLYFIFSIYQIYVSIQKNNTTHLVLILN